jgi:hypothetical protein
VRESYEELKEILNRHPRMHVVHIGELPVPDPTDPYWIEHPRGPGIVFRGRWEVEGIGTPSVEIPVSEELLGMEPHVVAEVVLPAAEEAMEHLDLDED